VRASKNVSLAKSIKAQKEADEAGAFSSPYPRQPLLFTRSASFSNTYMCVSTLCSLHIFLEMDYRQGIAKREEERLKYEEKQAVAIGKLVALHQEKTKKLSEYLNIYLELESTWNNRSSDVSPQMFSQVYLL
jgi:hypothetical protein